MGVDPKLPKDPNSQSSLYAGICTGALSPRKDFYLHDACIPIRSSEGYSVHVTWDFCSSSDSSRDGNRGCSDKDTASNPDAVSN